MFIRTEGVCSGWYGRSMLHKPFHSQDHCTWAGILPAYQQCRQAAYVHNTAYSTFLHSLKQHAGNAPMPLPSVGKAAFQAPLHLPICSAPMQHTALLLGLPRSTCSTCNTQVHTCACSKTVDRLQNTTDFNPSSSKRVIATLQHSKFPGNHSAEY